ncbi:hypothetical protein [Alistipes finegoldii]|nr:hypothetical protein [Alistipes finegoldii]
MNKILLFLLGGCIIGSAITIFSAQNKQKKNTNTTKRRVKTKHSTRR